VRNRVIDLRIAAAALLIVKGAPVANPRQNQAMADIFGSFAISRQPRDRSNGSRSKEKSPRIIPVLLTKELRQSRSDYDPGEIVIRKRGVAGMTGDDYLFLNSSR
jgi:hypothetical protein